MACKMHKLILFFSKKYLKSVHFSYEMIGIENVIFLRDKKGVYYFYWRDILVLYRYIEHYYCWIHRFFMFFLF